MAAICDSEILLRRQYPRYAHHIGIFLLVVITLVAIFNAGTNFGHSSGRLLVQQVLSAFKSGAGHESKELPKETTSARQKIILLWTQFFSKDWVDHFERNKGPYVQLGDGRSCYFTNNRDVISKADGLLFHGRDFHFDDLPKTRHPWQRWIFYLLESPKHTGFNPMDWRNFNRLGFNWTLHYRSTSDVPSPYSVVRTQQPLNDSSEEGRKVGKKISEFVTNFWKRKRDAIWMVSNCFADSRREIVAKILQEHGITLDSWGQCAHQKPDDQMDKLGPAAFFSQYRFYLSFENSLCDDYITEKGFQGLYYSYLAGSIPIVYGAKPEDYQRALPNGSYISVASYTHIGALAKYMRRLSCPTDNLTELASYYQWFLTANPRYEKDYEIDDRLKFIPDNGKRPGWFKLCKRLWDEDTRAPNANYSTVIPNMEERIGQCYSPNVQVLRPEQIEHVDSRTIFKVLPP